MCEDEIGRLLYKAMKAAPGSEVKTDPAHGTQDFVGRGLQHIGENHARMHSLAVDRQKERGVPYAHAYTEVYTNSANAALRAAVQREHLEHALAGIHGGVTHTLSIQQAQNLEPAKDFTRTGDFGRAIARKNAEAELQRLADARHALHPEESRATSYTKVLTDPRHAAIRKAALSAA